MRDRMTDRQDRLSLFPNRRTRVRITLERYGARGWILTPGFRFRSSSSRSRLEFVPRRVKPEDDGVDHASRKISKSQTIKWPAVLQVRHSDISKFRDRRYVPYFPDLRFPDFRYSRNRPTPSSPEDFQHAPLGRFPRIFANRHLHDPATSHLYILVLPSSPG